MGRLDERQNGHILDTLLFPLYAFLYATGNNTQTALEMFLVFRTMIWSCFFGRSVFFLHATSKSYYAPLSRVSSMDLLSNYN